MIISNRKNLVYPNLYLHGQVLTRVSTHKHLGMTLSDDMKWGAHIDTILQRAFNRLNGIRRLRTVAAWSPGGLLETPPRWHVTICLEEPLDYITPNTQWLNKFSEKL